MLAVVLVVFMTWMSLRSIVAPYLNLDRELPPALEALFDIPRPITGGIQRAGGRCCQQHWTRRRLRQDRCVSLRANLGSWLGLDH